ncbi:MAG TPA: rhodanese-like domain-containing protein [Candidatus Kapabacteria bacterium]|jgi:rhodanese-related sulfurtransferase|nr:rhodanese-like domain-containing protein [Candidatus Kapabacteria bacterium]
MHNEAFLKLVDASKARVRQTDVPGAQERLKANPNALLVDVREDDEFREEHVKGALHIGKGVIERDIEKLVPDKDSELLLYCGGGFRSALAADVLQQMGYRNVWSVDGGFRAYKSAGVPTERGKEMERAH